MKILLLKFLVLFKLVNSLHGQQICFDLCDDCCFKEYRPILEELKTNGTKYIFMIEDSMGTCSFEYRDKQSRLKLTGNYIKGPGLLIGYLTLENPISGEKTIVLRKYYMPLRNGLWIDYNNRGKAIKFRLFEEGIEIPYQG